MIDSSAGAANAACARGSCRSIRLVTVPARVLVVAAVMAAIAGCATAGEAGQAGRVVRVKDGDTLVVMTETGEATIRLLGVDTPEMGDRRTTVEHLAREATEFTRRAALDKPVTLVRDPEADDRDDHGRLLRYVVLPDGTDLAATIISQGYGHAFTRYPFSRADQFRAAEREARLAGRGLWSTDTIPECSAVDAGQFAGRVARVCGVVASTRYDSKSERRPTFINLGRPHPDQLATIVIWGADRGAFDEPERRYANRRICVTGRVEIYHGKPQIEANDPSQIVIAD